MEVAHAASGRAGGFLALDWCDGQETGPLARRSFLLHKELDTELGGCGYRAMRTLSLEVQPQRNGRKEAVAPDWVDGQTKHTRTIGTTETTAQVHPRLLTKSLMTRAEKLGARLVQAEVVGGQLDQSGSVTGVKLSTGEVVEADIVILCMGPWTSRGLGWFGLDAKLIDGTRAHSITMQLEDPDKSTIDNTALFLSSMKSPEVYPRPDGTVYMCGGCSSDHVPLPEHPSRVSVDNDACQQIKVIAGHVSDQLASVTQYTSSACYLPHSTDGVPIIGHVSHVPGLMVAAGHSCWGILQGPATGEAVAEMIVHGQSKHVDLTCFSPDRFFRKKKK